MKFNIVKAGGIGTVIRPAGLRHYLFNFGKTQENAPHLVRQVHRFFERNA